MSMIGFSQGTTVLQYAMAELPELFKKVTNVVGLIAPCGVMDTKQTSGIFNEEYYNFLNDNDILTILGPNWDANYATLCEYSQDLCGYVKYYVDNASDVAPIKLLMHYAQNADQYRPQLWIDDYFDGGDQHSRLIDWGMTKNKVAMWIGVWDEVCSRHQTAQYIT